jgi:hypothetical protein
MLKVVPEEKRKACVEALDLLSRSIDPDNEKFQVVLRECCGTRKGEGNR